VSVPHMRSFGPVMRDRTSTLPTNTVVAQGIAAGKMVPGGTDVMVVVVTPMSVEIR